MKSVEKHTCARTVEQDIITEFYDHEFSEEEERIKGVAGPNHGNRR